MAWLLARTRVGLPNTKHVRGAGAGECDPKEMVAEQALEALMGRSFGGKERKISDLARSVVRSSRIARSFRTLYCVVDFPAVDRDVLRSVESEPYVVTSDIDHRDDDVIVDDDALVLLPG